MYVFFQLFNESPRGFRVIKILGLINRKRVFGVETVFRKHCRTYIIFVCAYYTTLRHV